MFSNFGEKKGKLEKRGKPAKIMHNIFRFEIQINKYINSVTYQMTGSIVVAGGVVGELGHVGGGGR